MYSEFGSEMREKCILPKKLLFDHVINKLDLNACAYSITIHNCILYSLHTPSSLPEDTEPLHCMRELRQTLAQ